MEPATVKVCNERSKFRFQETKDKSELIDCPSLFLHCRQGIEPKLRLVSEVAIRLLIDDMGATIDIKRFAGDEPRCVVRKKGGGNAHVVDAHKLRAGAFPLALSSNASNSGMPDAARVASGPGDIA